MMRESDQLPGRLLKIGAAAVVMMSAVGMLDYALKRRPTSATATQIVRPALPDPPIAAEATVFRAQATDADLALYSRRPAHPRTLETYRALRAFPGAPPRIPHGVTMEEFRTTGCNACHERGGYSDRFEAYVPVTPHPERPDCLQCHIGNDAVMGIALPGANPDARCRQCHTPGVKQPDVAVDWRSAAWPQTQQSAFAGAPPVIPHDLQLRENCVTCHAGAGAVAEIRTDHPQRANCRQCHVTVGGAP